MSTLLRRRMAQLTLHDIEPADPARVSYAIEYAPPSVRRRRAWEDACARVDVKGQGYSAGGSWPPPGPPTGYASPWGPVEAGPGQRGGSAQDCPQGFYWDGASQQCLEHEHPQCGEGMTWNWDRYECVSTAGGSYPAPPQMGQLAQRPQIMGDYARNLAMHQRSDTRYFGTTAAARRRNQRRMVSTSRDLAAMADASKGYSAGFSSQGLTAPQERGAHMHGERLENGRGWVRSTRLQDVSVTAASGKSAIGVRRYNRMARHQADRARRGFSVGGPSDGGGGSPYGMPSVPGVFYGSQNPIRKAAAMRQAPSGWSNGFSIGLY